VDPIAEATDRLPEGVHEIGGLAGKAQEPANEVLDRVVSMIDRDDSMFDRDDSMIDRDVSMFDRDVSMFDRDVSMDRPRGLDGSIETSASRRPLLFLGQPIELEDQTVQSRLLMEIRRALSCGQPSMRI
jgi:hypothetical protein